MSHQWSNVLRDLIKYSGVDRAQDTLGLRDGLVDRLGPAQEFTNIGICHECKSQNLKKFNLC